MTMPNDNAPALPTQVKCSAKRHCYVSGVCFLIIFTALGYVLFNSYRTRCLQQTALNTQARALAREQATIDLLQQQQQQQANVLNNVKQDLDRYMQQLQQNGLRAADLAETKTLVKMALYNLQIFHNAALANQLLTLCRTLLQDTSGKEATEVKQLLADQLAQLAAIPTPNLTDIQQDLIALDNLVDGLTLTAPQATVTTTSSIPENFSLKEWRVALAASWQTLSKLVVIRQHDTTTAALLAPDQQAYLLQNIHLLLNQAQWAVLNQQAGIYKNSLQQVAQLIDRYFSQQTANKAAISGLLAKLQAIDLVPATPDLSKLLTAVNALASNGEAKS